ncbi:meiotic recombination protein DMC1/LIM15 homolog [Hyalella azteca]|uniref:Meiotic recombination protein DMC1/LIM15 homolog n=2 Tax=Hyalella azteca TaxID=294128 RepID=A0A8B7NRM2_HYAAZ|nr:meiotic recombination protein DMC1/LIM15 homolog [Hyalella azteca]
MLDQALERDDVELEDEETSFFTDIDEMQAHGINAADIKKLKSVGICTIKGVQMTTRRKLCAIKGLSEAKVDKIKEVVAKLSGADAFVTALVVCERRRCVFKVIFIDTENTFRPDRLRGIADRFNLDQDAVLDNVLYTRAFTSDHQLDILDHVAGKFHEEGGIFKLLIVDSVMALFRVDYSGRGELADRQQKLAQYLSRLQKISEEYNVAVVITNQMTSDPGAAMSFQADPKKPIGGHILAHASTTRVSLRKGRGETRIAKIYDSPDLPESEATFAITAGGIADAKE